MDAMHAAIKQKRSKESYGLMGDEAAPEHESKESSGMAKLCASLSPGQKQEQLQLLREDQEGGEEPAGGDVAKGQPTSEDKARSERKMADEPTEETDEAMLVAAKPVQE